MGTFTLRVRTPNGETLNEAIDLNGDGDASDSGETDPVVVNWEITGDCDTDNDEVADESCWMIGKVSTDPIRDPLGSFINASDVNDATAIENEVVDETYVGELWNGGTNISILDFLTTTEAGPAFLNLDFEILNPLLTISVVTPLENFATLNPVPYLEYQIQVDKPISDAKVSLSTIGYAQGKRFIYPSYRIGFSPIEGQSLIQFVIQN